MTYHDTADLSDLKWNAVEGEQEYVVPVTWDAGHVAERLTEAFQTLRGFRGRVGPKGFQNGWPAMLREPEDPNTPIDKEALEIARENYQREVDNAVDPPSSDAVSRMDEALRWPLLYLADSPRYADALLVWACAKGGGPSIKRRLRERVARGKVIALRREQELNDQRKAAIRKAAEEIAMEAARAEVEAIPEAERRAQLPAILARLNARADEEEARLLALSRPITVHVHDVMPDQMLSGDMLSRHLRFGLQLLAERLRKARVPVR